MKFKEAFERCQAQSSNSGNDETSNTLADQVTKMTIKDDNKTEGTTSQQGDGSPPQDDEIKKPAAAAEDKSNSEDGDKADTNS